MKFIYTFLIALLLISAGCKKQLQKPPIGLITSDQISTEPKPETMHGSVYAAYLMLSSTLNLVGNWDWAGGTVLRNDFILQDIASADMQKKWNPDGDQAWMDQLTNWSFTADNQAFNGIWVYDYEGISRSNLAISYLTDDVLLAKLGMNAGDKDFLLGQAYFLRSFYYFDLVNIFGEVPLLLKPLQNFNEAYSVARRTSKDSVYAQISDDLSKAKTLIPAGKYSNNSERWRISKGAVMAMQAKVALFNKRWPEVISIINEMEALGYYSLNANYFDNFDYTKKFTDNEVIFAYNHVTGQQPRNGNGICALAGWGFVAPTANFLNAFEPNDPRLKYTVDAASQNVYKIFGALNSDNKGNEDAASNKIFIRWADVMLWKAEALNETNAYAQAIGIINQVRARARNTVTLDGGHAPAGTLPARDATVTNKEQIKNWLVHERRVELGFESQRMNDLKRWELAKPFLTGLGRNFQDKNYLYPIPQGEVDKSAGSIGQNTGY